VAHALGAALLGAEGFQVIGRRSLAVSTVHSTASMYMAPPA
jgi:hypothetical protein